MTIVFHQNGNVNVNKYLGSRIQFQNELVLSCNSLLVTGFFEVTLID